jgi:hypothetical protein
VRAAGGSGQPAGLFLLAGVLTVLFVTEDFVPPPPRQAGSTGLSGLRRDIRSRGADRQLLVMMVVLFSAQFGVSVVQPRLPLFVEELDPTQSAATLTGLSFTVAGVVAAVSSLIWGRLGDRIGYRRLLIVMALGAGHHLWPGVPGQRPGFCARAAHRRPDRRRVRPAQRVLREGGDPSGDWRVPAVWHSRSGAPGQRMANRPHTHINVTNNTDTSIT